MARLGYFLACAEYGPRELVRQARLAEEAGFSALWISDHFHPWLDEQGHSPFVRPAIGALSEATSLPVTCPIMRVHPVVTAQAAATASCQLRGGLTLGVGTGEALNEHVVAERWPPAAEQREMLAEAVEPMRELWWGRLTTHRGPHYRVDTARLYTLTEQPPPVFVSAFGPASARLAGRLGDGLRPPSQTRLGRAADGPPPAAGPVILSGQAFPVPAKATALLRYHPDRPDMATVRDDQSTRTPEHASELGVACCAWE